MNSDIGILRERGYIEDTDMSEYRLKNKEKLMELMQDKEAWVRSAAVKMFALTNNMNDATRSSPLKSSGEILQI